MPDATPALLALCGLLVVASSLADLVGMVQVLRRKIPRTQVRSRLLPVLAVGALVATLVATFTLIDHIWTAGQLNLESVVLSLGPLVFVACTVAGLLLTVRYFGRFRRQAMAWHLLLTYGSLGWLATVLAAYGWMAIRSQHGIAQPASTQFPTLHFSMKFLRELFQKNFSTLLSMVLLVAVPLLGSSSLTFVLYRNQEFLENLTTAQSLLYFAIVGVAMAFSLVNTTAVVLITGFYLGWSGFPGMVVAYALAALVGYQIATTLDHGKMLAFLSHFPKADAVMKELKTDSWQLIFLTRVSPVTPFALMTFVLAIMRVRRGPFLFASIAGMLPRSLFFYWLGTKAKDVFTLLKDPGTGTTGKLLLLALVVVSFFGIYYLFNQALQRALSKSAAETLKKSPTDY